MSLEIATTFRKSALVVDLSDVAADTITQLPRSKAALFLLSNYGEGDPSDNATAFAEWLNASQIQDSLKNLSIAVLGLGNSTYKHYNQFARFAQETLGIRGAKSLLPLLFADDALGLTDEHFWTWTEKLFTTLKSSLGFVEQPHSYQQTSQISFGEDALNDVDIYTPQFSKQATNFRAQLSLSAIHNVLIRKAVNLTPHSDRTSLHVEVDISEYPELKYDIGDHMGIWPENPRDEVDALRFALGLDQEFMHKRLSISSNLADTDVPHVYSNPMTLQALFSRHLGICNAISRKATLDLYQFAPSAEASAKIRSITSDHETFARHKASYKITLAAMLSWASPGTPWTTPPSFVLEALLLIEPRYYSIASSPIVSPRQVSLSISLLSIPLQAAERIHGVASSPFAWHS